MVSYECFRCGYIGKQKSHLLQHLNRKNICKPLEDDMEINLIKDYYGFENNDKITPKSLQNISSRSLQNNSKKLHFENSQPTCEYCLRTYNRKDNLTRHLKTCKKKKEAEILVINQTEENIKTKKEIEELKEKIIDLLNKNKMLEIKIDNKTDELDCNYRQCMYLNKKLRKEKKI